MGLLNLIVSIVWVGSVVAAGVYAQYGRHARSWYAGVTFGVLFGPLGVLFTVIGVGDGSIGNQPPAPGYKF